MLNPCNAPFRACGTLRRSKGGICIILHRLDNKAQCFTGTVSTIDRIVFDLVVGSRSTTVPLEEAQRALVSSAQRMSCLNRMRKSFLPGADCSLLVTALNTAEGWWTKIDEDNAPNVPD